MTEFFIGKSMPYVAAPRRHGDKLLWIVVVFASVATSSPLSAQCPGVCGDVNSSGTMTAADIQALFVYLSSGDTSGLDLQCADMDDHVGVTVRDHVFQQWDAHLGWNLDCDPGQGPFIPMPNSQYLLHFNSVYPANDTLVRLYIDATLANGTQELSVVLRVLVDGQVPEFGEVATDVTSDTTWDVASFEGSGTGNIPAGHLLGVFLVVGFDLAMPGRHRLGHAQLVMPPSDQARLITIEQIEFPNGNITMAHDGVLGDTDAWALNSSPWIVDMTGDVNNDRAIAASDIIGLVNYVFKSGRAPYPHGAAGDINCTGSVTSADIVGLVNYVFKAGEPPCDVATQCVVTETSWQCP